TVYTERIGIPNSPFVIPTERIGISKDSERIGIPNI
uniref:Uncharacterized protein n=1 Tax=Romanomermis culicivorax TaxID=13658 RepID=A0A915HFI5_ROMCU